MAIILIETEETPEPGAKVMVHDAARGITDMWCLECGEKWSVLHDSLEEDYADTNPSECPVCEPNGRPRPMWRSQVVGHA